MFCFLQVSFNFQISSQNTRFQVSKLLVREEPDANLLMDFNSWFHQTWIRCLYNIKQMEVRGGRGQDILFTLKKPACVHGYSCKSIAWLCSLNWRLNHSITITIFITIVASYYISASLLQITKVPVWVYDRPLEMATPVRFGKSWPLKNY